MYSGVLVEVQLKMIAQASDDSIKLVPNMKDAPVTPAPELTEDSLGFTLI